MFSFSLYATCPSLCFCSRQNVEELQASVKVNCPVLYGFLISTNLAIIISFLSRRLRCIKKHLIWRSISHLMFCCKPAPMQRCSHDPLCDLLTTFPPSNLLLICIQHSARFVVWLPSSCLAFPTSLLSRAWMSCSSLGLISVGICPPCLVYFSVAGSSASVSLHKLS